MAEAAMGLALSGVPMVTEHYDKVYDPLKNKTKQGVSKLKQYRNKRTGVEEEESDFSGYEYDGPPRRSQTDRHRRPHGDHIAEHRIVRRDKAVDRPRTHSLDRQNPQRGRREIRRDHYESSDPSRSPLRRKRDHRQSLGERAIAALGLGAAATSTHRRRYSSASYSISPPRRRSGSRHRRRSLSADGDAVYRSGRPHQEDRTPARYRPRGYIESSDQGSRDRHNGQLIRRNNGRRSSIPSSSGSSTRSRARRKEDVVSDSSDVCSSSEDERRTRRLRGKEFLTAGLAAVATIHAAHGVYASMEARDKRQLEVLKGEMSPEEARKLKNKARIQDAAAIGIAALGIKGAYSEWKEVQESRHEMGKMKLERAERHEKRVRRAQRAARGEPSDSRRRRESR